MVAVEVAVVVVPLRRTMTGLVLAPVVALMLLHPGSLPLLLNQRDTLALLLNLLLLALLHSRQMLPLALLLNLLLLRLVNLLPLLLLNALAAVIFVPVAISVTIPVRLRHDQGRLRHLPAGDRRIRCGRGWSHDCQAQDRCRNKQPFHDWLLPRKSCP